MTITTRLAVALLTLMLAACATPVPPPPGKTHLDTGDVSAARGAIPPPVARSFSLPQPKPATKAEVYSVVVNNVKVRELLFALARDAKLNVDVHADVSGTVTLNAIDQTLPQLLNRIAKQTDLRWELDGPNLAVMPDTPYLRNYKIDYVNMKRDTKGSVSVTTQIMTSVPGGGSGGGGGGGGGGSSGGSGDNNSSTRIENTATNHFWETLVQNIKDILRETDKILPEGSSETVTEQVNQQQTSGTGAAIAAVVGALKGTGTTQAQPNIAGSPNPATFQNTGATVVRRSTFREAASVIANAETGVISIRATSRQHEKIQEFVDQVMGSARRQVLIEATIAEVQLTQNYQQGIDWSRVMTNAAATGLTFSQAGAAINTQVPGVSSNGVFTVTGQKVTDGGIFKTAIRLLEAFGTVKVLSSPKISVLNNQSAVLKVVDNEVYFSIKAESNQNANTTVTTFTTTAFTVPVGFVMNVTPQISENDTVLLNLRPSVSRVIGAVKDPNPALAALNPPIESTIPVIRTRELESVLRVEDGNIAVMGGLMEDLLANADNGIPGLSRAAGVGALFTQRNDSTQKTELVVFLRPIIVREASLNGDFAGLRDLLPNQDFFANNPGPQSQVAPSEPIGNRP